MSRAADLHVLAHSGAQIAVDNCVDNCGTGFAGFDYLRRLPPTTLMIDCSYVADPGEDRTDSAIVAAVITLGTSLGLCTVAEGIETETQRARLQQLGCPEGQGWLCHPALPAEQVARLLSRPARERPPR